jgi:hypothetical protein
MMDMRDMMKCPPPADDMPDEGSDQALLDALDALKAQIDDIAAQLVSKPPEVETPEEEKAPDEEAD